MRWMQCARAARPKLVHGQGPAAERAVPSIRLAIAADYSLPPPKYFPVQDGIKTCPARFAR